jgi:hypothetical protein
MVSHLLCQVDETGYMLVKQNESVQESPKRAMVQKVAAIPSVSITAGICKLSLAGFVR